MKRRSLIAALFCAMLAAPFARAEQVIRLSTTTSTDNSGLLKWLLPPFEAKTNTKVHVISVGTGKALELAKNGDVMYNDFVLAGPESDPAGVKGGKDVIAAFRKIAASGGARFISRGDNSGTDLMEKSYWQTAQTKPAPANYVSAGLGMGEVLNMAAELKAYTLTDRATYSAYKAKTGLAILVEGDKRMFNPYGIILVNPARHKGVNDKGARMLSDWITSPEGQQRIAAFKPDGEQLFFPSVR